MTRERDIANDSWIMLLILACAGSGKIDIDEFRSAMNKGFGLAFTDTNVTALFGR